MEKKCRRQLSKNTKYNLNFSRHCRHTRLRPSHKEHWGSTYSIFHPNRDEVLSEACKKLLRQSSKLNKGHQHFRDFRGRG